MSPPTPNLPRPALPAVALPLEDAHRIALVMAAVERNMAAQNFG